MLKYSYDPSGNVAAQTQASILPPQIIGQPVQQIVEPGQAATFSVVVSGAIGVTYQWKFNGADIAGAIGDSLLLANVSIANEGQYSVLVTNSAGSVTSAPAELLLDSNGDGLPDSWQIANFGNLTSQRSEGDPDLDGVSNLDEFLDGTNPNSNTSLRPRLTAYSDAGGSVTVVPMKLSYDIGERVTLTATPSAPNVFVGWTGESNTGDLPSTTNPVTFAIGGNSTIRARFASAMPLPPELVAFWRGETDASDLIGGHNGTFFAGTSAAPPSVTPSGKVGGAFSFDGTVHVLVPDSDALKPPQITVEAWVFPTLISADHQTVIARGSPTNEDDAWWMGVLNGKPRFWSKHSGQGMLLLEAPSAIPLNEWTHLAISFDGMTKRLYVNGAQVLSQGGLGALFYEPAPVPVTIGSDWAGPPGPGASSARFNGFVDEVALYNRALTINEIYEIYNADFLGKNVTQPCFTSPSRLADVAPGVSYSRQLTTILGNAPISLSLSAGMLPPGMTLSSTGLVSGLSNTSGTFDFTALATDAAGMTNEQLFVLRVLQPVALPADMIAWWRAEPATNNMVPDDIGAHDGGFFSGNTQTNPVYSADGEVGSAISFDGTHYVRVPDAVELRPTEMTAELWVFPTVLSGNHQTAIARGSSTSDDDAWWVGVLNGKPRFWSNHLGSGNVMLEAPSAIPLNQWTHLAISFDGATRQLFVNGVEVASQRGLSALVYDAAPVPVTIGCDWARNAPTDMFTGRVDEVSLYQRALSSEEIFSLFDAGPAGKSVTGPYINSSPELPFALVGQPYAFTFTSVRGKTPVFFDVSQSTLPAGLTLTPGGLLSGVPTKAAQSVFVVRVTDNEGLFAEQRCAVQAFESVLSPAGMVGWWRAEGTAQDSAGTNHGTLRNGAGFSVGQVGQAFSLDGQASCIEIPDVPALRPASLTLEAWVAADLTSGVRVVFAKPVGAGTSDSYALWLQDGALMGAAGDAAGIGSILTASSFSSAPARWHHAAYTFDDIAKQQALYLDGVQVAVGSVTKSIGYDGQPLLLGRDTENGTPSFFLRGRIDEATVYNRALGEAEIASIYNAGPAGKRLAVN